MIFKIKGMIQYIVPWKWIFVNPSLILSQCKCGRFQFMVKIMLKMSSVTFKIYKIVSIMYLLINIVRSKLQPHPFRCDNLQVRNKLLLQMSSVIFRTWAITPILNLFIYSVFISLPLHRCYSLLIHLFIYKFVSSFHTH